MFELRLATGFGEPSRETAVISIGCMTMSPLNELLLAFLLGIVDMVQSEVAQSREDATSWQPRSTRGLLVSNPAAKHRKIQYFSRSPIYRHEHKHKKVGVKVSHYMHENNPLYQYVTTNGNRCISVIGGSLAPSYLKTSQKSSAHEIEGLLDRGRCNYEKAATQLGG